MKKIRIRMVAIASFLFLSMAATAQKGTLKFNLNYNYSLPQGAFKSDLVSNSSPRGATGGLMYSFTNKLEAGVESGFQDYYQKYPRAVYSLDKTQDISAVLSNSIHTTPLLLKAKYSFLDESAVRPYVSLGAGANLVDFNQYFGEFRSGQTDVGFVGQGGLGVKFSFGKFKTSEINVGATYDYAPFKKYGYQNLNSVNLQAGIAFRLD